MTTIHEFANIGEGQLKRHNMQMTIS